MWLINYIKCLIRGLIAYTVISARNSVEMTHMDMIKNLGSNKKSSEAFSYKWSTLFTSTGFEPQVF